MNDTISCPHCNSNLYIKHGHYKDNQRYKCRSCLKTYTSGSKSIWNKSKKSHTLWLEYFKLMSSGLSIRECAYKLNICIDTSFRWRHKILNKTEIPSSPYNLHGRVLIKHTYFKENFKGQKTPPVLKTLNNRDKIYVLLAINKYKNSFAKVSFRKSMTLNDIDNIVSSLKYNKKAKFIPAHDIPSKRVCIRISKRNLKLSKYNSKLIENLTYLSQYFIKFLRKIIFKKYRGIATKYLDKYLNWLVIWFENKLDSRFFSPNIHHDIFC